MSQVIILVDDPADWAAYYPTRHLLSARDYLQAATPVCTDKKVQVINLCRGYKYLSPGYYCSLLAEATGFAFSLSRPEDRPASRNARGVENSRRARKLAAGAKIRSRANLKRTRWRYASREL